MTIFIGCRISTTPSSAIIATLATLWEMATLRLANGQIYPFDYKADAREIGSYVKEIVSKREEPFLPTSTSLSAESRAFKRPLRS